MAPVNQIGDGKLRDTGGYFHAPSCVQKRLFFMIEVRILCKGHLLQTQRYLASRIPSEQTSLLFSTFSETLEV
jgi:hypothetical protein